MAGKYNLPCCPRAEEPPAVPLPTATTLAPARQLWSTRGDEAVKLRMENSGPGSEPPMTIHQMFKETVEAYGDHRALASKKEGEWVTLTWREYYQQCRAAAKSFLKVCLSRDSLGMYIYSLVVILCNLFESILWKLSSSDLSNNRSLFLFFIYETGESRINTENPHILEYLAPEKCHWLFT